ncbi:MAG: aminotransferase class IV [Aquimonas sp.]|nr:aminotransferase class IV [Aquimonas sp.]
MSLYQWMDARLGPADTFSVPLNVNALHYGTGVFEGIRSYATQDGAAVFRLREHLLRMKQGCEVIGIDFDMDEIGEAILAVLRANQHRDAYIRPLSFYGSGLGLDVEALQQHHWVASVPWNSHLGSAKVKLAHSPFRRNRHTSIPPLKLCGAYVNSLMAKHEATKRGFGEALFTDESGLVVECTGENVFMVKNGQITAVEHPDALGGITRRTVIELTGADSRAVSLEELREADEIFLTGTSAEIAQVGQLDQCELGPNPVTLTLRARYLGIVRGESAEHETWLTRF